jgi:tryptophanyl-tRNA synthetase
MQKTENDQQQNNQSSASQSAAKPHTVLAGIRASGQLHLGNYLGAVKGMLALQDDPNYQTYYMVADAHGVTTPYDPRDLKHNRRSVIIDYLAAGLDPDKSVLFLQSDVIEHFALSFYLSSVTTVSRMKHLPTYKEKVEQYPEHVTMALLNYPVLMAADILLYQADKVPVGLDQVPHLEVAREIARKMNQRYQLSFPEPTRFATKGEYIPSLKGQGKMSKSVPGSYINLTDDLETIKQRLAGAPTDSGQGEIEPVKAAAKSQVSGSVSQPTSQAKSQQSSSAQTKQPKAKQPKTSKSARKKYIDQHTGQASPGVANLLILVELFQGTGKRQQYEQQYCAEGIRYQQLKQELAAAIYQELKPFQQRRAQLEADPDYVDRVIQEGAAKARLRAEQTLKQVRAGMGLS